MKFSVARRMLICSRSTLDGLRRRSSTPEPGTEGPECPPTTGRVPRRPQWLAMDRMIRDTFLFPAVGLTVLTP
ncbi:hypothetical protein BV898_11650 [Hypsibius exemplaris]|uniref:Uncharacterized protein n=1 Tax=Hypsibius exemplaris TaxID=2072580 RepID=A0A1W0WG62_HYPEX|nr:hypothetical protein BV898_11650 [Hypsibius exemplaris]